MTAAPPARPRVVVYDYGSGNVRSAVRALERVGADVELTADARAADGADGLVVPGVGAFEAVAQGLQRVRGGEVVGRRLAAGRPVLGICVGMQVLFETGVEHGRRSAGLGEWPGTVERLEAPVVPHMGWNTVDAGAGSRLFAGVEGEHFYFVHSYGVQRWQEPQQEAAPAPGVPPRERRTPPVLTWAEHGTRFLAAVEDGPLAATQFHPEKSGDAGAHLLENWVGSLR